MKIAQHQLKQIVRRLIKEQIGGETFTNGLSGGEPAASSQDAPLYDMGFIDGRDGIQMEHPYSSSYVAGYLAGEMTWNATNEDI